MAGLNVLSLFSGCGGLDLGFKQIGFEVAVANDIWSLALETFRLNFPEANVIADDITRGKVQEEIINLVNQKIHVVVGGPPCQAYSLAGTRDPEDPRGKLFQAYVEIVDKVRPSAFVMENVSGILSMRHFRDSVPEKVKQEVKEMVKKRKSRGQKVSIEKLNSKIADYLIPVPELIKSTFKRLGYKVEWKMLNAADYGVPQSRKRVFFVGTRTKELIIFPAPTHSKNPSTLLKPWVTLKDAIGDLPFPGVSEGDEVYEGSFSSIYMSRNRKKNWDDVSYTIQAGARHIPLHPESGSMKKIGEDEWVFGEGTLRRLSVKECARIQTFPDDFVFLGTTQQKYKQIGNAVPPLLARRIADCIKQMLK